MVFRLLENAFASQKMDLDIFNYFLKAKVSPISSPLDRGKLLIPRVVFWKLYRPPKKEWTLGEVFWRTFFSRHSLITPYHMAYGCTMVQQMIRK